MTKRTRSLPDVVTRIPAVKSVQQQAAGELAFQMNTAVLPSPERALSVNYAQVEVHKNTVEFVFGQRFGGKLQSALVVETPVNTIVQTFAGANHPFLMKLMAYKKAKGIDTTLPEPQEIPARVVFERASLIHVTQAGDDCELRLYRISPCDLHTLQIAPELKPPVIRPISAVYLATALLLGLIEKMGTAIDDLTVAETSHG